jgi:hypothetical protein
MEKTQKLLILALFIIGANMTLLSLVLVGVVPNALAGNAEGLGANSRYGLLPMNADGSVNVRVAPSGGTLDVNLQQVNGHSIYGALEVKIQK